MRKYFLISIVLILSALLLAGCSCKHEWIDATCDSGKVCSICGSSEGEPLAHIWTDATCTASRMCTLCAATDGDPLPHSPGETETSTDYVRAVQIETTACADCCIVLSTNETTISLIDRDCFLLSPEEFVARLNHIYALNGKTNWSASLELTTSDGQDYNLVELRCDDIIYARVFFASKIRDITAKEKDERIVSLFDILISYPEIATQHNGWTVDEWNSADTDARLNQLTELLDDEDLLVNILDPLIQTCNPHMPETDAEAFARNAYELTCNPFGMEEIRYQAQCGDCYIGVYNLFLADLSYRIRIGTTSEFWIGESETGN